jgi:hypothetical protein
MATSAGRLSVGYAFLSLSSGLRVPKALLLPKAVFSGGISPAAPDCQPP